MRRLIRPLSFIPAESVLADLWWSAAIRSAVAHKTAVGIAKLVFESTRWRRIRSSAWGSRNRAVGRTVATRHAHVQRAILRHDGRVHFGRVAAFFLEGVFVHTSATTLHVSVLKFVSIQAF